MTKLLQHINHQWLGILGILVIMVGMFFSPAMMSIGMIVLLVNALFNHEIGKNWQQFIRHRALLALTAVFFIYLFTALYADNLHYLAGRLNAKLPFLILPFSMLAIPRFSRDVYFRLLLFMLLLTTAVCLHSLFLFLQDFENITYNYREGKVMPTPVQHIRFSLIVAFCVAVGWYLYQEGFFVRWKWERGLILGVTVFLILYLHVLAVRSGLLVLYGLLAYFAVRYIVVHRRYAMGLIVAVALGGLFWLSYELFPTLKNKINYTIWNLQQFEEGKNLEHMSDSYRLGSITAGLAVGRAHPLLGVSMGDIQDETEKVLAERYPALTGLELIPQNQYVFVFAGAGLLGLVLFIIATTYPLFYRQARRDLLLVALHIIVFLSFLVEPTIELQLGTAFYILFVLMGIRFIDDTHRQKTPA